MAPVANYARRATTFLVALFLWIHALFFLNVQSPLISTLTKVLRLGAFEVVLFGLLLVLSILGGSGFWRTLGSFAYIYFFPFVLLVYALYGCAMLVRAVHKLLKSQANLQFGITAAPAQKTVATIPVVPQTADDGPKKSRAAGDILRYLARPFERFTVLWGILLIVTSHTVILWLCLVVVSIQLARKIVRLGTVLICSDQLLRKIGEALIKPLNDCLALLAGVTREASPSNELKNLWSQVTSYRKIVEYLKNEYIITRWAWILAVVFFGFVYIYFAVLFSFAYCGIARLGGLSASWLNWLVTSLFIPFFISGFPGPWELKLLGGLHCLLILSVGFGTLASFLRRALSDFHKGAIEVSDLLTQQAINEKYAILEEKFSAGATPTVVTSEPKRL
jgi:hypothetical protein